MSIDEVRVLWRLGVLLCEPISQDWEHLGVGVEHSVHVADVASPEARLEDVVVAVEAVLTIAKTLVVAEVPRRLLEVTHQPSPLENLCENVARLLAGQVHSPELSDRVVTVFVEDLLIEVVGPVEPDGCVNGSIPGQVEVTNEFI